MQNIRRKQRLFQWPCFVSLNYFSTSYCARRDNRKDTYRTRCHPKWLKNQVRSRTVRSLFDYFLFGVGVVVLLPCFSINVLSCHISPRASFSIARHFFLTSIAVHFAAQKALFSLRCLAILAVFRVCQCGRELFSNCFKVPFGQLQNS